MPQTFVITGANRGIGLELTRQLMSRGARVIAGVRDRTKAGPVIETGARVVELDVADEASIKALGDKLAGEAVDVLINNAGVSSTSKMLSDCQALELMRVFAVNSVAPVLMVRALLPCLRSGTRKVVANVSSQLASIKNNTGGSSYGYRASKAALNMLTVCMANELRNDGITCLALHPGWVKTDMGGAAAPMSPEQSVRFMLDRIDGATIAESGTFRNYDGTVLPW